MSESSRESRRAELAHSYRNSGEVLVEATRPKLLRVARKLGLDPAAAKDVVQQAFAVLFGRRPEVDDLEGWLVSVVTRRSVDWKRREALESGDERTLSSRTPAEELSAELRLAVRSAVSNLSERMRRLVEARYFEGCSESEAASAAGYSPSSFKKTMTRALRTMRGELERGCRESRGAPLAPHVS